jgi:hypothetical protein
MAHLPSDFFVVHRYGVEWDSFTVATNLLAGKKLLHFHRVICTRIMRVGMTQIHLADAMHRTHDLSVTLVPFVNECASCKHFAAMSSAFRHILAR